MISRVTLFSLLLGLMLGIGLWMNADSRRDACSAYANGDKSAQSSEYVDSGSRRIAVPCSDWIMRQPFRIQILCLLELCLTAVFLLNAAGDLRDGLSARRRRRNSI